MEDWLDGKRAWRNQVVKASSTVMQRGLVGTGCYHLVLVVLNVTIQC